MATTKALELAQLADGIDVNANGEITNISTLSSLDISGDISTSTLSISGNTTSSNTTTGALTVTGGIGTEDNLNAGRVFVRGVTGSASDIFLAQGTLGNVGINYEGANLFFTRDTANYISASGASGHLWFRTGGTARRVFIGPTGDINFTTSANTSINGFTYTAADSSVDIAGNLIVGGNFTVSGNTTFVNTDNLQIEDLNITLASGATSNAEANGAGITIDGSNATILYDGTNDEWDFNKTVKVSGSLGVTNIVTNKVVKFDGNVLNDSNISDDGSTVTIASPTIINGSTASAGGNETLILANNTGTTQLQFGTAENLYAWMQVDDSGTKRALLLQAEGGDIAIGGTSTAIGADGMSKYVTVSSQVTDGAPAIELVGNRTYNAAQSRINFLNGAVGSEETIGRIQVNYGGQGAANTAMGEMHFYTKGDAGTLNQILKFTKNGQVQQQTDAVSGADWQIINTSGNNAIRFEGSTSASLYIDGSDGDFSGNDYGRIYHDGTSLYLGTHGASNLRLTENYFMWNTNTNATPFYIGRNGATNESLRIMVDDASVNFYSIQDESTNGNFKFFLGTNADQNTGLSVFGEGSTTALFDVRADGTTNIRGNTTVQNSDLTVDNSIRTNQVRHSVRPSLLLDFANSKRLDSRIAFTRSSTATYWDGKTKVKADENLMTHSQNINGTDWNLANVTILSDSATAPDGTATGDFVNFTSGTSSWFYNPDVDNLIIGKTYTFSIWVKAGATAPSLNFVSFTTVRTEGGGFTPTSEWVRYTWTKTMTSGGGNGTGIRCSGTNGGAYFWGFQIEERSSATAYTPTTTSPITRYQPVIQTASANRARFDHDPSTGESKGLLIEESRTNKMASSTTFDAGWSQFGTASGSNNVSVAPDGTITAGIVSGATDMVFGGNSLQKSFSGDDMVTASLYVKKAPTNGATTVALGFRSGISGNTNYSTISLTDDWQRIVITRNLEGYATDHRIVIGNADGDVLVWGTQVEAGEFATSYIPTSGSAVTRSRDFAVISGNDFESFYSHGQGTTYAETTCYGPTWWSSPYRLSRLSETSGNHYDSIGQTYTQPNVNSMSADVLIGYSNQYQTPALATSDRNAEFTKHALAFERNNFMHSVNGALGSTDYSGEIPEINALHFGAFYVGYSQYSGHIKKFAYYPERLSDAELQALTEE